MLYNAMNAYPFSISAVLSFLLMSSALSAETLVCQGTISGEAKLVKEVKISVEKDNTHLISLIPLKREEAGTEIYSSAPVGIGTIEIVERLDKAGLVIARGKLLVTGKHENLITGILIHEGRQFAIRLNRTDKKWSFILHDSNHRETISGSCK